MIVLRSKPRSGIGRYFFAAISLLVGVSLLLQAALQFSTASDQWDDLDLDQRLLLIGKLVAGGLGIILAFREFVQKVWGREPRQRLIASEDTFAIASQGRPTRYIKRRDIVALTGNGSSFVTVDGMVHTIPLFELTHKDIEGFLDQLYAHWWPGLTREEVILYLQRNQPTHPLHGGVFIVLLFSTVLLIPSILLWERIWIPITLLCILSVCTLVMGYVLARRHAQLSKTWRYPVYDECDEFAEEAWNDIPLQE